MPFTVDETKVKKIVIKDADFNREHDFGDMNIMKPFPEGKALFEDDSPKASDVEQGENGSCYLMGVLRELAGRRPEMLRNMFRENEDGTVTIRFYQLMKNGNKCPVDVTIDKTLPNIPDGKHSAPWVLLFEKAFIVGAGRHFDGTIVQMPPLISDMKPNMHLLYEFYLPNETFETFLPQKIVENNYEKDILKSKEGSTSPESRFHDYQENLNQKIRHAWERKDIIYVSSNNHVMSVAAYKEDQDNPEKSTIYVYDQMTPSNSRVYTIKELTETFPENENKNTIAHIDIVHLEENKVPVADKIDLNVLTKHMRAMANNDKLKKDDFRSRVLNFIKKRMDVINHFLPKEEQFSSADLNKAKKALSITPYYNEAENLFKDKIFKRIKEKEFSEILDISHPNQEKALYILNKMLLVRKTDINKGENNQLFKTFLERYEKSFQVIEDTISKDIRNFTENRSWSEGEYLAGLKNPSDEIEYADPIQPLLKKEDDNIADPSVSLLQYREELYIEKHSNERYHDSVLTRKQETFIEETVKELQQEDYRKREKDREAGRYHGEYDAVKMKLPEPSSKNYADEFQKLYQELLNTKHDWSNDTQPFKNLEEEMARRIRTVQNSASPKTVGEALISCRTLCEEYQKSHMREKLNDRRLRRLSVMSKICLLADQFEKNPCPKDEDLKRIADERIAVELMNHFCPKAVKNDSKSSIEYKQARMCLLTKKWRDKYVDFMCTKNKAFQEYCGKSRESYLNNDRQTLVRDYMNCVNEPRKQDGKGNRGAGKQDVKTKNNVPGRQAGPVPC